MKTNLFGASSALALVIAQGALAQDATVLDSIIFSGGFTPIEEKAFGRSASVLTAAEIETRGIKTVQNALRAVPGVSVSGTGDSYTQVRIRGAESTHTLILIDGIEATGGDGEYILTGLDTANIDRIEVLRGPQSVYYGSNASAGVINIITKKGDIGTEYGASLEYGSGFRASARVSTRTERGGVSLNLSRDVDEGFDYSGSGGEKDGIERSTVQLSGDHQVGDALKIGATFRKSKEHYEYDASNWLATSADTYVVDSTATYSDRDEQLFGIFAELQIFGGRATHRLSYDRTDYDQSYFGGTPTETETKTAKHLLSIGLDDAVDDANHLLNAIFELEQDSSSSNAAFNRKTISYAVEYRGRFDSGLDLQLGVRSDNNNVFEDVTTWNASASYAFGNGVRLHSSAGTGSVNPSYFELFAANDYVTSYYAGNPNLVPEQNRSFDIGVEVPVWQGRGVIDVTYFNETLTNEIEFYDTLTTTGSGKPIYSYRNQAGESTRKGLEIAGELQATDALDLRLSYTYLNAKNPDGSVEVRRPEHELSLGATLAAFNGRGSINADIRRVVGNYGSRFFAPWGTVRLPDYTTVDLAVEYNLSDSVVLTGRVTNLCDVVYSDVLGFAKRGRTAYVGLKSAF